MKSEKDREQFTARVLTALVTELATLEEAVNNIKVQIAALAKEHAVSTVGP